MNAPKPTRNSAPSPPTRSGNSETPAAPQIRDDTIVALSTAPGRGAIALIRMSGPEAYQIGRSIVARWPDAARRVQLSTLNDPVDGLEIDQGMVTRFNAPHSYTGENMVEIACHGGVAVTTAVLNALIGRGAREAEPGEFTQRAVLHGKLDILQAEAVADLVDARTTAARGLALSQLHGLLSSQVNGLRESVLQIEALLAYDLDFPDEDDGPVAAGRITEAALRVIDRLSDLLATAPLAEVASDGALVVIAGAPNVGKSSLFNALVGSRRAIVTDLPGTTRDAIEARLDAPHWPLRLIDTAGLRETQDTVERLGIEVSEQHIRRAHVVLVCDDNDDQLLVALETVGALTHAPRIPVRTKVDRRSDVEPSAAVRGAVAVSATTGLGLEHLLASIEQQLAATLGAVPIDQPVLTRTRHRVALEHARSEMKLFADAWASRSVPSVVAAVHVRSASAALDELIGSVEVDDILEQVFRTFCVGK